MLQGRMTYRVARPREARMSFFHQAIAADEKRSRPAVQVHSLWNLLRKLVRRAGCQHGIRNSVVSDESFETRAIRIGIALLKIEVHDLQPI